MWHKWESQFARLNNKICYFSNDIVSVPIDHPNLEDVKKLITALEGKIEKLILSKKLEMVNFENKAILNNERFCILRKCDTVAVGIVLGTFS